MWICQICYMGLFKLGPLCLKQCLKEEKNQICQNKSAAPPKILQALTSKGASRRTGLYFTWSPFPWIARRDFSFSEKKVKIQFQVRGLLQNLCRSEFMRFKKKVWDWSTLSKAGRRIQFCIVALTFALEQGNLLFILQLHTRLKSRYFFFNMKRVKKKV